MRSLALAVLLAAGVAFANDSSVTVTTATPGLFTVSYEHVFAQEFGFEFSYGARMSVDNREFALTPYVVAAYYGESWGWWAEVSTPDSIAPHLGDDPYWLRSGIEYRW